MIYLLLNFNPICCSQTAMRREERKIIINIAATLYFFSVPLFIELFLLNNSTKIINLFLSVSWNLSFRNYYF